MKANTCRLLLSGPLPGPRNMALDAALAGGDPPAPTLRLYRWRPWTLSLGYFQRVREEDLLPWLRAGHDVTRRATGGGAIFHAEELTYSLVLPAGDPRIPRDVADSYAWTHGGIAAALAEVGVRAAPRGIVPGEGGEDPFFCFRRTASVDLVAGGRKIVGSAQRRTATAFLQHGSIPLAPDPTAPEATSVAAERGGVPVGPGVLEEALARAFEGILGVPLEPAEPTGEEEDRARVQEQERFGNRAWVLRPWKGPGRATTAPGALPPPPPPPGGPRALRVLRAVVDGEALEVRGSVGGTRPSLPHRRLRALEAARVPRREVRALSADRDPWDSTFRRSLFGTPEGGAGAEGSPPERVVIESADPLLALRYGDPEILVLVDARRFNYADLGEARTGRWKEDARTLLRAILARAPGAAAGEGARALLDGRPVPVRAREEDLLAAVRAPGSPGAGSLQP